MADPVMKEREEPRFMSFSTGDVVDGILVLKEKVMIKEKPAIRYTVKVDDGDFVAFLGTHQLNTKLRITDIGHFVSIRCEGEDTMVKRGENCMKVFRVLVSENPATDGDLYISDADIPF